MISAPTRHLNNGDALPNLVLRRVGGDEVVLSRYLHGAWGVVLFYRGDWCPYCNAQLSAFQRKIDELTRLGVRVVAISVDRADEAEKTVTRSHLTFPVLYGADPKIVAQTFGSYTSTDSHGTYVNSTNFVVDPDGKIVLAVYSSGAIGRIAAEDAVGFMNYLAKPHP